MPEDIGEITPVKRGPGRPRKHPLPEPTAAPEQVPAKAEPVSEKDSGDPRIGQTCHPDWSGIGYDDGTSYRCENGVIVERVH